MLRGARTKTVETPLNISTIDMIGLHGVGDGAAFWPCCRVKAIVGESKDIATPQRTQCASGAASIQMQSSSFDLKIRTLEPQKTPPRLSLQAQRN